MGRPCEYVLTFMPFWTALRVFGVWPQRVTKGGRVVRTLVSLPGLACAIFFVLSTFRTYIGFLRRFEQFKTLPKDEFAVWVLNAQFTLYLLSQLMIPLNIFETGRMSRYAARWQEFQPELQRLCGRRMQSDKLRRTVKYTTLAISTGWPLAIVVLLGLSAEQAGLSNWEVLTYAYITTVLAMANTNWRMHCAFWLHAASMFSSRLEQMVQSESLTKTNLGHFLAVWVELRRTLYAGTRAVGSTTFCNMSIMLLTLVLCVYNTMYIFFNGFSKLGAFLSGIGFLTAFTMSRLFNAAHLVNEELGDKVVRIMSKVSLKGVPRDALQELDTFRNILASSPVRINVLGYLPVNRASLGAVWVTVFSYLVVLIQFTVD